MMELRRRPPEHPPLDLGPERDERMSAY